MTQYVLTPTLNNEVNHLTAAVLVLPSGPGAPVGEGLPEVGGGPVTCNDI